MSVEIVFGGTDEGTQFLWSCSNMDYRFIRDAVFESNPNLTSEQRAMFQYEYALFLDLSDPKDHGWARVALANARQWIIDFDRQKQLEGRPPSERLRYLVDGIANVEAHLDGVDRRDPDEKNG